MERNISDLPYELQLIFLINLRYPDIIKFCQSNKKLSYICDDEYLWRQLVRRDFPDIFYKNEDLTFKEFYIENYHFQELLMLNYPSLYELKLSEDTFLEVYLDIEGYIEDQTLALMDTLGISISDEASNKIISMFRDFSSVPSNDPEVIIILAQQINYIILADLYHSTKTKEKNEEKYLFDEYLSDEYISEEEFNNIKPGLDFESLLSNSDDIHNYVACIISFLLTYEKCEDEY